MSNPANPLIPTRAKFVERLGPSIVDCPALHLGAEIREPADILRWANATEGKEGAFSPAACLVQKLARDAAGQEAVDWFWDFCRCFFLPWSGSDSKRYDGAIELLRVRHQEQPADNRDQIEEVFYTYLAAARTAARWNAAYRTDPGFRLLNARGDWTPINRLALDIPGVSRYVILDARAAKALGLDAGVPSVEAAAPGTAPVTGQDRELMKILADYAEALGEKLNRRHWGVFLVLLESLNRRSRSF